MRKPKATPIRAWAVVCRNGDVHFEKGVGRLLKVIINNAWCGWVGELDHQSPRAKCGPHRIVELREVQTKRRRK